MAKWNTGEKNGMWKGGKILASNGYVLIRVGVEHPRADVRGYAYEHRLVAEKMLDRPLTDTEIVHHRNGIKKDNRPANLEIVTSVAEHWERHRLRLSRLRKSKQENPLVQCKCGCGTEFKKFDGTNRPREYVSGHNPVASPTVDTIMDALQDGPLSRQQIAGRIEKPMRPVATALSKMKAKGLIEQVKHGVWKIKEG